MVIIMYRYSPILISALIIFTISSCNKDDGKIPVTSSSEEATSEYRTGLDLLDKLQVQESRQHFRNAIGKDPDFALAYLNLAFAATSANEFFENLAKAVTLADKVSEGERLWILGSDAGTNGFADKQRELYIKLITAYPNDERAHTILGNQYFGQQEWAEAIKEYNKSNAINPDFSPPYNQLGYAHRSLGQYDEAEKAFQKYIELIPNDPNPYDSYAELLMKMGKFEESIQQYKKALMVNSNFVPSHIGIASNLVYLGKYDEAREQLKKLEGMARNDGELRAAYFAKAITYVDEGNMEQALTSFNQLYESNKKINDPVAMANNLNIMGVLRLESGNYDEAQANFEKALESVQSSNHSQETKEGFQRAYVYNTAYRAAKEGDLEKAKSLAEEYQKQADQLGNENTSRLAHQIKGIIALEEKDDDQAINELKQASQQDPYNLYRLAVAYSAKGDIQNSETYLYKALHFNIVNSFNFSLVRHMVKTM